MGKRAIAEVRVYFHFPTPDAVRSGMIEGDWTLLGMIDELHRAEDIKEASGLLRSWTLEGLAMVFNRGFSGLTHSDVKQIMDASVSSPIAICALSGTRKKPSLDIPVTTIHYGLTIDGSELKASTMGEVKADALSAWKEGLVVRRANYLLAAMLGYAGRVAHRKTAPGFGVSLYSQLDKLISGKTSQQKNVNSLRQSRNSEKGNDSNSEEYISGKTQQGGVEPQGKTEAGHVLMPVYGANENGAGASEIDPAKRPLPSVDTDGLEIDREFSPSDRAILEIDRLSSSAGETADRKAPEESINLESSSPDLESSSPDLEYRPTDPSLTIDQSTGATENLRNSNPDNSRAPRPKKIKRIPL